MVMLPSNARSITDRETGSGMGTYTVTGEARWSHPPLASHTGQAAHAGSRCPVGCGRLGLSPEVLVHGALVDGCGWRAVPDLLTLDGYHLAVVQNPTVSLQGDAAATRLIIDMQPGPVVLVGHSYGASLTAPFFQLGRRSVIGVGPSLFAHQHGLGLALEVDVRLPPPLDRGRVAGVPGEG